MPVFGDFEQNLWTDFIVLSGLENVWVGDVVWERSVFWD
jgi:hypothetical protein